MICTHSHNKTTCLMKFEQNTCRLNMFEPAKKNIYIHTSWCGKPHVLAGDWELEESTCIADFSYWGVGMVMMCLNVPKNSLVLLADRGPKAYFWIRHIIGFNRISTVCFGGSRKEILALSSSFQPWRCFSLWVCWRETRNFHDFHGRKTMVTSWFAHVISVDFPASITWGNHEVTIHYKHEVFSCFFSSYPYHVFQYNPLIRRQQTHWCLAEAKPLIMKKGKERHADLVRASRGSWGFIWNGWNGGTTMRSWGCQCFFLRKTTNKMLAQLFFCWQREKHNLQVRF